MKSRLRTLLIVITLACVGFGLAAAFPYAALALIYFMLYPLAILVMVSLIVGALVLGRFLIERIRH
ncbi:MAG: hypothetical protein HY288_02015 [Planctomycetia bacterium]|nr:hypothetical protein [Planctomycetia bacterium]